MLDYSIVRLCNCYMLDSNYNHTVYFKNKVEQITWFNKHVIYTDNDYEYQRKNSNIKVGYSLEQLQNVNYIIVDNDNGERLFYFVMDKEYISEEVTNLILSLDLIQTYLFDINFKECLVERMHVQDFNVDGENYDANLYPKYCVDEGLQIGEYELVSQVELFDYIQEGSYVFTSSERLGISNDERLNFFNQGGGGDGDTNGKIEKAIQWAIDIANDDTHGYDQENRWGVDYDCSSFVIQAFENGGIPLKTNGATYTGNMKTVCLNTGFKEVSTDFTSSTGLLRGDILLNEANHTAIYLGNNKIVHASINELGTTTGGQSGDQNGKEICIRDYYNYPWDCVLRYEEQNSSSNYLNGLVDKYGVRYIKYRESFAPTPYDLGDGTLTTGYGCTSVYDPESFNSLLPSCTEQQASVVLCNDLKNNYCVTTKNLLDQGNCNWEKMTQGLYNASVSFVYNSGGGNFTGKGLRDKICGYTNGSVSLNELIEFWKTCNIMPGSIYEEGLRKRRKEETELIEGTFDFNSHMIYNRNTKEEITDNNGFGHLTDDFK